MTVIDLTERRKALLGNGEETSLLVPEAVLLHYIRQFPCFVRDFPAVSSFKLLMEAYLAATMTTEQEIVTELIFDLLTDTYFACQLKDIFGVLEEDDRAAVMAVLQFHNMYISGIQAGIIPIPEGS